MRTTRRAAVGRMVALIPSSLTLEELQVFSVSGTLRSYWLLSAKLHSAKFVSRALSCVCRKRSRAGRQEISFNGGGKSAKDAEKQRQDDICDERFAFIPALAYYINCCPN